MASTSFRPLMRPLYPAAKDLWPLKALIILISEGFTQADS
jgi:hypothetical protein